MPRRGSKRKVSKRKVSKRKGSRKGSRKSRGSRKGSKRRSRRMSREAAKLLREVGGKQGHAEFIHKTSSTSVKNGKLLIHEEMIIKGDKGLLIKHYHKSDTVKVKMVAKLMEDGSFSVRTINGEKKDEKTMTKTDFLKLLAKDKNLKFALDYLKTMKGGARRRSRSKGRSKKRSKGRSRSKKRRSRK